MSGIITTKSVQSDGHEISMTMTIPDTPGHDDGGVRFAKFYHWVVTSGKLAEMSGAAAKVYLALLYHVNFIEDRMECSPSIQRLADRSGASVRAVHTALSQLVKLGMIALISGKNGPEKSCANQYLIRRPSGCVKTKTKENAEETSLESQGSSGVQKLHTSGSSGVQNLHTRKPPLRPQKPGSLGLLRCAKIAHKEDIRTKKNKDMSNSSSGIMSGDSTRARPLWRRLVSGGVDRSQIAMITQTYAEADIITACANADALKAAGNLRNWGGYVVETLRMAKAEGKAISPTQLAREITQSRQDELESNNQANARLRAERSLERQRIAFERWGNLDRWKEVDLSELSKSLE